jgi:hypothetical protein
LEKESNKSSQLSEANEIEELNLKPTLTEMLTPIEDPDKEFKKCFISLAKSIHWL